MTDKLIGARIETYRLAAANGRHIRIATRVILENGEVISFMDRLTKRQAIAQAAIELRPDTRMDP
jgi:hypothetical protein